MALKVSISGVRGMVPKDLTPEICLDLAKAFGSYLYEENSEKRTVVVGTDPRSSSEFIKGIVFSGLLSTGCKVIDLGICPTPTVGIMVRELEASGGIVITASHNPLPWNGLKFIRRDGIFLNETQGTKFLNIFESKDFIKDLPKTLASHGSALDIHIKKILKAISPSSIRRKKYKVALDCGNGAGSEISIKLLNKLGCQVEAINCDVTKAFPRNPEPTPKNLGELIELVKQTRSDIGFAFDSDADRLAIVSEKGKPVGEEMTLALAVKFALAKNKHKNKLVITNLCTTRAIDDIIQENQGIIIRTKIGEVHIAEELKNLDGMIGGEGNGGVIYPPVGFNRDALTALTIILKLMSVSRKKISELLEQVPSYHMVKKKIKCKSQHQADALIDRVKEEFRKNDIILTDGVKVLLPSSWIQVRASNTEPIIRIIAEGKEKRGVKNLIKKVLNPVR
jgi:phosphomannomutase